MPFTNPGRSPVALAEIQAHGRQFPALSQVQMQAALKAALRQVTEDELPGHGGAAHQLLAASITHHTEGEGTLSRMCAATALSQTCYGCTSGCGLTKVCLCITHVTLLWGIYVTVCLPLLLLL
eukprot:GHUV01033583.1.p1 GENE.GHUV01033583.1~~GHUV01033583.1.p1  ORF type:complete len:123 (+),score=25.72 GHUV01033583.1:279-647(+)